MRFSTLFKLTLLTLTLVFDTCTYAATTSNETTTTEKVNTSDSSSKDTSKTMDDSTITAKIKGLYIREKLFGNKEISVMGVTVETKDGVVSLSGTVDTQAQADNAVKIAKTVDGVKSVNSKIEVKPATTDSKKSS